MGRVLAKAADRMLATVLPHATASGCHWKYHYSCEYPHSCNNGREMSHVRCITYCDGNVGCSAIGCC